LTYRSCILAAASCALWAAGVGHAATGAIGTAATTGEFLLDGAEVRGNASVLDGSLVQTTTGAVRLTLKDGAEVDLANGSQGKIYRDRVVLEQGASQSRGLPVDIQGVRVSPAKAGKVRIGTDGARRFEVTAVNGTASVRNPQGVLIAEVPKGESLAFAFQDTNTGAGAGAATQITGCIERIKGTNNFVLRDSTTQVVYQVAGPDVEANVGKNVTISGSPDASAPPLDGTSQMVRETSLTPAGGKGCKSEIPAAAAAAGGGGGAAAAAAGGGGGIGGTSVASIAIISGIVVGGTLGGLAAAGAFSSPSTPSNTSP